MTLPIPVCVSLLQLNVTVLSQFCYVLESRKMRQEYLFNMTEVESFLLVQCCPSFSNMTTPPSENDQLKGMCMFLQGRDHSVNETCHQLEPVKIVNHRADVGIVQITYLSLILPLGILSNLLVIYATFNINNNNASPMLFINNLGIADLITLVGFILVLTLYKSNALHDTSVRLYLFPSLDIFTASASLLFVMAISIDRAIAVLYPVKHFSKATRRKGIIIALSVWIFCSVLCLLSIFRVWIDSDRYRTYFVLIGITIACFIPCCIVIICYAIIIFVTIKSNRKIIRSCTHRYSITSSGISRFREIKLAISVSIIIIPFVCGWGYMAIVTVYQETHNHSLDDIYLSVMQIAPLTVSSINPLIYLLMTSSLRKITIKMIHEWLLCRRIKFQRLRTSLSRGSTHTSRELYAEERLSDKM